MKLNDFAMALWLSLGVLGAAQPADHEPNTATNIHPQITSNSAALPGNTARLSATDDVDSTGAPASAMTCEPMAAATSASDSPQASGPPLGAGPAKSDQWRFSLTPYLWFPGVHGNAGAFDRDVTMRASAIDLLSKFRFGLMAAADAEWDRLVLPLDVFWVRLADTKALPFPDLAATTANIKAGLFLLTPKVGYRFVNDESLKFDVLTGFRFWHFAEDVKFSPSILNLSFSRSQNWTDPLVGVRIEKRLSGKVALNLTSDVGGWGVGSQLDYQVTGQLGYKIKENTSLQAGYRYLFANYAANAVRFDAAMSGVTFGITMDLK
jgi:hypothetical protein